MADSKRKDRTGSSDHDRPHPDAMVWTTTLITGPAMNPIFFAMLKYWPMLFAAPSAPKPKPVERDEPTT